MDEKQLTIGQTLLDRGDTLELRFLRGEPVYADDGRRIDWQRTRYEVMKIVMDRSEWVVVVAVRPVDESSAIIAPAE